MINVNDIWIVAIKSQDRRFIVKYTWLLSERPLGFHLGQEDDGYNSKFAKWVSNNEKIDGTELEFQMYSLDADNNLGVGNMVVQINKLKVIFAAARNKLSFEYKTANKASNKFCTDLDDKVDKINKRLSLLGSDADELYTDGINIFSYSTKREKTIMTNKICSGGAAKDLDISLEGLKFINVKSVGRQIDTLNIWTSRGIQLDYVSVDVLQLNMHGIMDKLSAKSVRGLDLSKMCDVERVYGRCIISSDYLDASKYKFIDNFGLDFRGQKNVVLDFKDGICGIMHDSITFSNSVKNAQIYASNDRMQEKLEKYIKYKYIDQKIEVSLNDIIIRR